MTLPILYDITLYDHRKEVLNTSAFIQTHITWLVPIASILFTVLIKMSAKPDFVTLGITDYFDFGFDLSISSMVVLLTGIKSDAGIWLLFLSFLLIVGTSIIVNRIGWNKRTQEPNWLGVLLPDFIGIILLVGITQYLGGAIK